MQNFKEIKEGKTRLLVPEQSLSTKGAGKIISGVFYNPAMKLKRRINVVFARTIAKKEKEIKYCDLLSGIGASGLRVAKEAICENAELSVSLNEINENAFKILKKNAELNSLKNIELHNKEAGSFLFENRYKFDVIEVDPFGSPSRFIEPAISTLKPRGYLITCATDKATLQGNHVMKCFLRYSAYPIKFYASNELGLRILLGYIARIAAKYDRAIEVLLAFSDLHYYECYLRIIRSKAEAKKSVENLGYLYYCTSCRDFFTEKNFVPSFKKCIYCKSEKLLISGLLWLGEIKSNNFIESMVKSIEQSDDDNAKLREFLENLASEESMPFYHDLHFIASMLRKNPPKVLKVIEKLKSMGLRASRTHFSEQGIKTDAELKDIAKVF